MQLERKDKIMIVVCKAIGYITWFSIFFIILYRIFSGRMDNVSAGCMVIMWTFNGYQMGKIRERMKREKELEELLNGRKEQEDIYRG